MFTRLLTSFLFLLALPAFASDVLFPAPLHLTREISVPFAAKPTIVDDYCLGDRIVSIAGRRTAIVDYARREVTAIDFQAGIYSITSFEALATAREDQHGTHEALKAQPEWRMEDRGGQVIASRPAQSVEAHLEEGSVIKTVRISSDRDLKLRRDAVEALLGTAYPARPDDATEMVLGVLRAKVPQSTGGVAANATVDEYSLPLEYVVEIGAEGETATTRNVVVRVGSELPPGEMLAVPPGAKRVEAGALTATKRLDELDHPPVPPAH